jgi:carboxyl-terminal processing protease
MKSVIYKRWFFRGLLAAGLLVLTGSTPQFYDSDKSFYLKLKVFSDILEKIRTDYIEEKDPQKLIDSAIRGVVADLDPHTTYFTKEQFEKWNQDFEGYSGIGIYFDVIDDKITVISVIKNGPSDKIGLRISDRIVAIDGESAVGIKRDDVPLKLMGPKGTKVTVTVERTGWTKPKQFALVREEVHLESLTEALMIKPQVGYIGVARFTSTTDAELEQALKKLEWLDMKWLVLDFRQNGGGYLDAAVKVTDKFLPRGKRIVYTKGRIADSYREYFSTEHATHPMIPMIVLIDRASASASEIVAGALQDWDRALIAGETSFGKGLVQNPYRFNDGSALLMTTACYYTPSDRMIQRPYDNKSVEEYYREVFDNSKKNQTQDNTGRPVFKTMILGRKVYGGGGITPDVPLKSEQDTLTLAVRDLVYSPKLPFFTFIENYVRLHPHLQDRDVFEFVLKFRFGDGTLSEFRVHLQNLGIPISQAEFLKSKGDIQFFLKRDIAQKLWGEEAAFKVQVQRDRQLLEALDHLSEAEALLSGAYSSWR